MACLLPGQSFHFTFPLQPRAYHATLFHGLPFTNPIFSFHIPTTTTCLSRDTFPWLAFYQANLLSAPDPNPLNSPTLTCRPGSVNALSIKPLLIQFQTLFPSQKKKKLKPHFTQREIQNSR